MERVELPNVTPREYECLLIALTEGKETPPSSIRDTDLEYLLDKLVAKREYVSESNDRLSDAEPQNIPEDAKRDEDGEAVFDDDDDTETLGDLFG